MYFFKDNYVGVSPQFNGCRMLIGPWVQYEKTIKCKKGCG